jgi:hypothetical protein
MSEGMRVKIIINEEFTELLKGKKIVMVACEKPFDDKPETYEIEGVKYLTYNQGRIFIFLDDGSVIEAWNSEWGGIGWYKKKEDIKEF